MSSVSFIAQMKLWRLREQREVLLARYDAIAADAARAADSSERLRALYDGLRAMEVAGAKLHPEVCNLDASLLGSRCGVPVDRAIERLEREVRAGRLRCDVMWAFGALLEQWASSKGAPTDEAHDARVADLVARSPAAIDLDFVSRVLAGVDLAGARERLAKDEPLVTAEGVRAALDGLAFDGEKKGALRAEARRFAADAELLKDLVDALRMLGGELDHWGWPEEGVALRSVWTGDRWRVHVDEDLVTAVMIELFAARWQKVGNELRSGRSRRIERYARLRELAAPAVILENEARMLDETAGVLADPMLGKDLEPGAVLLARDGAQTELLTASTTSAAGYAYGGGVRSLIAATNAELRVARAARPNGPYFGIKTDLEDFFPSIDHRLVLAIAEAFGIPRPWLEVLGRYLAVPVRRGDDVRVLRRGLPLGHDLSRLLAELVLAVVELHARRGLPSVQVFRLVDDIVLLSPSREDLDLAWARVQEACAAMGLALSRAKSGSFALGAERPAAWPQGPFRVGPLELDATGAWVVSDHALAQAIDLARAKVGEARSALEAAYAYNTHVRRLVAALVPSLALGEGHTQKVGAALARFHADVFALLEPRVAALAGDDLARRLPRAWFHWPLTAGGLGLVDPWVELAPYAAPEPVDVPGATDAPWADVEIKKNAYGVYYLKLLETLTPRTPDHNPRYDGLARDFIKRKAEMKGQATDGELAPYWQWVLSTHGADVLDAFGTYRFLLHELLPIHLLRSGRQPARQQGDGDDMPSRAPEDDIPF